VLVLREGALERVLPRVSPRLSAEQLRSWLNSQGVA